MPTTTPTKTKPVKNSAKKSGKKKPGSKKPGKQPRNSSDGTSRPSPDQWPDWTTHLATRQRPRPLGDLIDTKRKSALEWPLDAGFPGSESAECIRRLERLNSAKARGNAELAQRLEVWLDEAATRAPSALLAIECLGWAHALPQLSQQLPAAPWCQLLDQLVSISRDAAGLSLTNDPVSQQLLSGELPFSLAYLFPELRQCELLLEPARAALSEGILELLDGEGVIAFPHRASGLRPLLASWTRCGHLARAAKQPCFTEAAQEQFESLVRESMRFARPDGSQVLSHDVTGGWEPTLFKAALKLIGSRKDSAIARAALPAGKKDKDGEKKTSKAKGKLKSKSGPKLPEASMHSEWAGAAVLKRSWHRDDPSLVLAYHDRELACELNRGGETIWSGDWSFQIEVDGRPLEITDAWEEVCWIADEDVAYVELEAKLSDQWRLQRQFLLGRNDQFLLVADALLGNRSGNIIYQATLPLAAGIRFEPADETREGRLVGRRGRTTVMPLSLPEWRLPAGGGVLEQNDDGLTLAQQAHGFRLFAPLFFDLNPGRAKKPLTWRQLTVGENLDIASNDDAVGYRVQVGNEQWLFYRSLGPTANRTVLGQNLNAEFVAARFPVSGDAETMIEIE